MPNNGRRVTRRGATRGAMRDRISIVEGDITEQEVDAIVNSANTHLTGGALFGGVIGAIHRAAGPQLKAECRTLGGCDTGEAKITGGYDLPARYVIHTVAPVWREGAEEDGLLAHCYGSSLALAGRHEVRTIAFPSIGTGSYGFTVEHAAPIAIAETVKFLKDHELPESVIFVCHGRDALDRYQAALDGIDD